MKKRIQTSNAPEAIGPYSQAIEVNGTLYVSGQVPIDPVTKEVINGDITEQTKLVLKNVGCILEAAGYSFSDVVKTTCLLKNMEHFADMNAVYTQYFDEVKPARATFEVARLPKDVLIEIETIAVKS